LRILSRILIYRTNRPEFKQLSIDDNWNTTTSVVLLDCITYSSSKQQNLFFPYVLESLRLVGIFLRILVLSTISIYSWLMRVNYPGLSTKHLLMNLPWFAYLSRHFKTRLSRWFWLSWNCLFAHISSNSLASVSVSLSLFWLIF
jgi:hypothetical protein